MKYIPLELQGAYPRYGIHTSILQCVAQAGKCFRSDRFELADACFPHVAHPCKGCLQVPEPLQDEWGVPLN